MWGVCGWGTNNLYQPPHHSFPTFHSPFHPPHLPPPYHNRVAQEGFIVGG